MANTTKDANRPGLRFRAPSSPPRALVGSLEKVAAPLPFDAPLRETVMKTKTTHTPGPRDYLDYGAEAIRKTFADSPETIALLLAAPDLLAALIGLEGALNDAPSCFDSRHMLGTCPVCEARAVVRAAIAKAEAAQ